MRQPERDPRPWWRFPMMWLVVGGPLAVVVAATVTGVVAARGADPVLQTDEARAAQGAEPAMQARNHAATPAPAKP
jgi:uncharacterized protein